MANPYYDPKQFGLTMVGEVDFSDGCYCFDYTTVWQRTEDGAFLYADDSGCSCPAPYEGVTSADELTVGTLDEIKRYLDERNSDNYAGPRDNEIAQLVESMLAVRR